MLKSIWFSFAQNPWFRKSRFKGGKGKKLNIGGGGLGYRERPGLGSESSVSRDAEEVLYRFLELLNSGLTSLWLFFFFFCELSDFTLVLSPDCTSVLLVLQGAGKWGNTAE